LTKVKVLTELWLAGYRFSLTCVKAGSGAVWHGLVINRREGGNTINQN